MEATLKIGADMRKINFCFQYLKELYFVQHGKTKQQTGSPQQQQPSVTLVESSFYDTKETKDLKETLKQRDNEISMNKINKILFKTGNLLTFFAFSLLRYFGEHVKEREETSD